jgi:cell division protein FtsQ
MDGEGRLPEPLSDAALTPQAAAPAYREGMGSGQRRRAVRRGGSARAMRRKRSLARTLERLIRGLERLPRHAGVVAAVLMIGGSCGYGVLRGGHLDEIVDYFKGVRDMAANAAGFRIASVALTGQAHLSREEILASAGVTGRASLLFFDVGDARVRLLTNPWIAEVTVQKLLPDRLAMTIVERAPFALWQKDGRVSVIAGDGTVLEPYVARRYVGLPLVVGAGAETRAKEFLSLLDSHPELRANVRASVLVAQRRWNLRLKNGVDIRLPEFDVAHALDQLAALERDSKLSARDIVAIDLRLGDRVTVRLSDDAAEKREEALKKKAQKTKGSSA